MIYELTIADDKEKQVIAFLKQLDFVTVKKVEKKALKKKPIDESSYDLPYFGSCLNWDIEASDLRKTANKRLTEW